jgi:hypothetical protein
MKCFARMMGYQTAAVALSIGLFSFASSWFGEQSNPLQLSRCLVFETRRKAALRHRAENVAQVMEIKQGITAELVAGHLHLREAIVQFQKANQLIENEDRDMVAEYRTPTDPEGVARQVLAWVDNEVAVWPPDKAQRTVAPLEKQFQEMFPCPSSGSGDD